MLKKKDFIAKFAEKEYTIRDATIIVDDFLDTLEELLASGESVSFHGFGAFDTFRRKERESVNVHTGEKSLIPSHLAPRFKPGKVLKRAVREGFVRK